MAPAPSRRCGSARPRRPRPPTTTWRAGNMPTPRSRRCAARRAARPSAARCSAPGSERRSAARSAAVAAPGSARPRARSPARSAAPPTRRTPTATSRSNTAPIITSACRPARPRRRPPATRRSAEGATLKLGGPSLSPISVMPAQAGTHASNGATAEQWVPACAGMTEMGLLERQGLAIRALIEPGHEAPGAAAVGVVFGAELRGEQALLGGDAGEDRRDRQRREDDAQRRAEREAPAQRVDQHPQIARMADRAVEAARDEGVAGLDRDEAAEAPPQHEDRPQAQHAAGDEEGEPEPAHTLAVERPQFVRVAPRRQVGGGQADRDKRDKDPAVVAVLALAGTEVALGEDREAAHYPDRDRQPAQRRVGEERGKPAAPEDRQAETDCGPGDLDEGQPAEPQPGQPQTSRATSTTRRNFAFSSSIDSALPSTVEEKPHCGLRHSWSSGT